MNQVFFNLLPEAIFWLVCLFVSSLLVRRKGLSRKPLNTAKNSILSMKKKVDDYSSSVKKTQSSVRPSGIRIFAEAKRISFILKDAKKAHDALAVYCYDNRMNKESAEALKTIDTITELLHKLSKGIFSSTKDYEKAQNSLVRETGKAVNQIEALVG